MRLTVLGGCGAWPEAGKACSGFLVEHDGFRLLVDLGYATVPRLLELLPAEQADAVFISHGHPDHCADLNPLLRARALRDAPAPALPVYALPGALDAVLALDRPGMLADAYALHEFSAGASFHIGPFRADTRLLPHWVPNAGVRLTAGHAALMYSGDSGPSPHTAGHWRTVPACSWPRPATSTASLTTPGCTCPARGRRAGRPRGPAPGACC